jgi:hypothetical protein
MKIKYKVPIEAAFAIINEVESFGLVLLTRTTSFLHSYDIAAEHCVAEVLLSWAKRHRKKIIDSSGLDKYSLSTKTPEEAFALQYLFCLYGTANDYLLPFTSEFSGLIDKATKDYVITMRKYNNPSNEFAPRLQSSNTPTLGPGTEWMSE